MTIVCGAGRSRVHCFVAKSNFPLTDTHMAGAYAQAKCLNISGSYEIAFGMPECAAGSIVVKAWKKYEQTGCKNLSFKKVYKLKDGNFCEGVTFHQVDNGQEMQNEGSFSRANQCSLKIEAFA